MLLQKVDQRHEGGDEKRADLRNAEKDHLLKRSVQNASTIREHSIRKKTSLHLNFLSCQLVTVGWMFT